MVYAEKIQSIIDYLAEIILTFQMFLARVRSLRINERDVLAAEIRLVAHLLDKEFQLRRKHTNRGNLHAEKLGKAIEDWEEKFSDEDESILWAKDVLNRYVTLVLREETEPKVLGIGQLLLLIRTRRSVRRFGKQEISDKAIAKIIEAGKWAPSSCNRQPCRFIVIRNRSLIGRVGRSLAGGVGFAQQAAAIIVVLVDLRMYSLPVDRHIPYLDGAAATMNMLLAIHSLRLGGCWIHWKLDGDRRKVLSLLGVENHMLPISTVAVGQPEILPPPPGRMKSKSISKIL